MKEPSISSIADGRMAMNFYSTLRPLFYRIEVQINGHDFPREFSEKHYGGFSLWIPVDLGSVHIKVHFWPRFPTDDPDQEFLLAFFVPYPISPDRIEWTSSWSKTRCKTVGFQKEFLPNLEEITSSFRFPVESFPMQWASIPVTISLGLLQEVIVFWVIVFSKSSGFSE